MNRVVKLHGLACAPSARPRPLEIVSTEPARDVDRLADEIETADLARFHRLGRQRGGVDATHRHFGLRPSFRRRRAQPAIVRAAQLIAARLRFGKFAIVSSAPTASANACARRAGRTSAKTVFSSALRRVRLRSRRKFSASRPGARSSVSVSPSRQYDEICRIAGPERPRWVNKTFSRKLWRPHEDDCVNRDAAQRLAKRQHVAGELQPYQARPWVDYSEPKAAREIVREAACSHFRNREPAGRDHQRRRGEAATVGLDAEAVGPGDRRNLMANAQIDRGRRALREQHRKDLARRSVAEELAQGFLVVADAMALDHRDEVALGVTAERGLAEVRVGRDEALGRDLQIGEVAAAAARDQNFGARLRAMFEQQHAPAAPPRANRAHQPGRSGAQHHDVKRLHRLRRQSPRLQGSGADLLSKFA